MLRRNNFRDYPTPKRVHHRANRPIKVTYVYVRPFVSSLLGDKVVDHILHFKKNNNNTFTEKMLTMALWNP